MPLSVNDKKAIVWIAAIILAANVGMYFLSSSNKEKTSVETSAPNGNGAGGGGTAAAAGKKAAKPFPFDPNTADYNTFLALGLKPGTAKAIVNYRNAGGVFRCPKDFARIYTLDESNYKRLLPYITIKDAGYPQSYSQRPDVRRQSGDVAQPATQRQDSYGYTSYKLKPGQTIDLNQADSASFQRIPGIGPYYAGKIIRYRNRLGGFVSLSQIKEVHGVPDDIGQWLKLSKTETTKLKINKAEFKQLLRHPYFSYEQVVAVFNYRKVYGNIHNISELANYAAFTQSDFARLAPYLDYSE